MFDDFEVAFNTVLDSYEFLFIQAMTFGQVKLYVEGDVTAEEAKLYLARHGIASNCFDMSNGVVVALAGADERRARSLLENWA